MGKKEEGGGGGGGGGGGSTSRIKGGLVPHVKFAAKETLLHRFEQRISPLQMLFTKEYIQKRVRKRINKEFKKDNFRIGRESKVDLLLSMATEPDP